MTRGVAVAAWLAIALPVAQAGEAIVLRGARVLDADGERWLEGREVAVADGAIREIAPAVEAPGARRIEIDGLYLVPGLIDLHTHLLLHPYDETPWDDQVLRESLELRTLRAAAGARASLHAGFTTLRDLGTEGAGFADVALREAIRSGIAEGPRVLATTRAIVASASYGPAGFDPRWQVPQGAQEASGVPEVRRVVREQIAAGADWIKVYADYRRRPGAPTTPTFSQDELDALVDEARSAGLPVAAHATTAEGIRRSVQAGAATIEHGDGATPEVLRAMRERNVVLCPTLAASEAVARYAGWKAGEPEPERVRGARELVARARAAGVTIACGSDAGVFAHGNNAREIELLVAYGLTPTEALRAATATAARVLGEEARRGRIAPGFVADLAAFRGDPLKDPEALRNPVFVMLGGRVVVEPNEAPPSSVPH